jgi:hypothetical protein
MHLSRRPNQRVLIEPPQSIFSIVLPKLTHLNRLVVQETGGAMIQERASPPHHRDINDDIAID